jgi:hypothetical protein
VAILETAFGFNADSTIDKYFISKGTFCLAKPLQTWEIILWIAIIRSKECFVLRNDLITFPALIQS